MITVDTNIYISAFQYGRKPLDLLDLASAGVVRVSVSTQILSEFARILRDSSGRSDAFVDDAVQRIRSFAVLVSPIHRVQVITEDPDDDRILECALSSGSHTIVTGDKDLIRRGEFSGIRIMRVSQYLDEIRARIH